MQEVELIDEMVSVPAPETLPPAPEGGGPRTRELPPQRAPDPEQVLVPLSAFERRGFADLEEEGKALRARWEEAWGTIAASRKIPNARFLRADPEAGVLVLLVPPGGRR